MTDQHKDDAMLDQYLDGQSKLSKKYKEQDKYQPSADLDGLILSSARDAVRTEGKKSKHVKNSWLIPASIAATVVLSFSLIQLQKPTEVFEEEQEMELDIASVSIDEKPAPAKRVLEKKKERRKAESLALMEEQLSPQQLADAMEPPATVPLVSEPPAMASAGLMAESATYSADRKDLQKQHLAKSDERILSKEDWLIKIKTLLKGKKQDEAKKEYERFIKAYPNFLPDAELKQQLGLEE